MGRLQADNATLKKELLSRNLSLPAGVKPDPKPTKVEEPRVKLKEIEVKQVMGFFERVWRRLVEMVVSVQRDILKKT